MTCGRIILAANTGDVRLPEADVYALCVRHDGYDPPVTGPGCRHVTAAEFLRAPTEQMRDVGLVVVVGLGRILTPQNRTRVGPYLLRPLPGIRRISVDRTLFVVEPWRAWWHFGCVGARYREYTYSYLAESHWRGAQDGMRDDPFTLDAINEAGRDVIESVGPAFFKPLDVVVRKLPPRAHAEYQTLKARAFDEEHTSAAIVRRLAVFAQEQCPERHVPSTAQLFSRREPAVLQTDLGVDEWLVGRLRALVALTNGVHAAHRVARAA